MSTDLQNARCLISKERKGLGALALHAVGLPAEFFVWSRASLTRLGRDFHSQPVSKKSLRLRLSFFFTVFLLAAWLFAAFFAWMACKSSINEFFDTQQMIFAKRLAETDFAHDAAVLSRTKERPDGVGKKAMGKLEDDALGFSIFTASGEIVMADAKNGRYFAFAPDRKGFSNEQLSRKKGGTWRIVRLAAKNGGYNVAVGQDVEYRRDMALEILGGQFVPWLVLIPVLLLGLIMLLGRELAPLRTMATQLRTRAPEDATALDVNRIPSEALPMAEALNGFFAKTNAMLARERSFISDAAHELRTPLAGLRVQAQVAAQEGIGKNIRAEALGFLLQGIDRCARLVEQLLALSRLDAMDKPASPDTPFAGLSRSAVNVSALLAELICEYRPKAERKNIILEYAPAPLNTSRQGYPALISMLLRNLLDNAVLYSLPNGRIRIFFEDNRLTIANTAPALPEAYAARLGERFFRPPGQKEPGSGLGLSIAKRIAEIHRFGLTVQSRKEDPDSAEAGFRVTVIFTDVPMLPAGHTHTA